MGVIRAELSDVERDGLRLLVDEGALARRLLVAFTDRMGGMSVPPYESLNLAARVGDDLDAVHANRARVAEALRFKADALALARQVHGADSMEVAPGEAGVRGASDVLIAREPGPVLGILTADCAPIVLDGEGGVAVVHAGWRGLVAGAIEVGVEAVGTVRAAWVGPAIRGCCYEVGPEVIEAFKVRGLPIADETHVDVSQAASAALRDAGVEQVAVAGTCTHHDPRYFSFRRDGVTGRQGAFVALLEDGAR